MVHSRTRARSSLKARFGLLLIPLTLLGVFVSVITWSSLRYDSSKALLTAHVTRLVMEWKYNLAERQSAMKGVIANPERDGEETERWKTIQSDDAVVLEELELVTRSQETRDISKKVAALNQDKLVPLETRILAFAREGKKVEANALYAKEYLPLRKEYEELFDLFEVSAARDTTNEVKVMQKGMSYAAMIIVLALIIGVVAVGVSIRWLTGNLARELTSAVAHLEQGGARIDQASRQISETSVSLANSANQSAAAQQQTAASIDEISTMVAKNAESAQTSQSQAEQSRETALKGKQVMEEMARSISEISEGNANFARETEISNREISDITKLISEIAAKTNVINDIVFQTKLLSFNASVESARAGEHGKGFAVVAEEVGNLARMSGVAAREISELVTQSTVKVEQIIKNATAKVSGLVEQNRAKIDSAVETAGRAAKVLTEIVESAEHVKVMTSEIASASQEQAQGISEANRAITELDQVAQENMEMSRRAAAAAGQLREESKGLQGVLGNLSVIVRGGTQTQIEDDTAQSAVADGEARNYVVNTETLEQAATEGGATS